MTADPEKVPVTLPSADNPNEALIEPKGVAARKLEVGKFVLIV